MMTQHDLRTIFSEIGIALHKNSKPNQQIINRISIFNDCLKIIFTAQLHCDLFQFTFSFMKLISQ